MKKIETKDLFRYATSMAIYDHNNILAFWLAEYYILSGYPNERENILIQSPNLSKESKNVILHRIPDIVVFK